jgi:hypothetical protein
MVHLSLAIAHHQQDTDYYCGAGCAQMVLDSIGSGLQNQDTLYTDMRNHTAELASWFNPPDGLQWLMNDRRPAGFNGWFALYSLGTEDAQSRKLVWTLHHYGVSPIALVYGGDHWLVVRGCDVSQAPQSSGDVSYSITSFDVNNPWPPLTDSTGTLVSPPPPLHGGTDGCGTGGVRGVANENISYTTWRSTYMTANGYGTLWNGKFVSVCDPDLPADRPGELAPVRRPYKGEELLTPDAATASALEGIVEYGLTDREEWSVPLRGKPGPPTLVQRLDRIDSYYYLVPFADGSGENRAVVSVDARFGNYRQAISVTEAAAGIPQPLSEETIRRLITDRKFELPHRRGTLEIRGEIFSIYPALVWRPCRESLTPYVPFHLVTVGDHRLYVRIDGNVFTKLHTDIPGI